MKWKKLQITIYLRTLQKNFLIKQFFKANDVTIDLLGDINNPNGN
jgi:hypothetical protein